jgi:hypothetical protein
MNKSDPDAAAAGRLAAPREQFVADVHRVMEEYVSKIVVASDGYPMMHTASHMRTLLVNAVLHGEKTARDAAALALQARQEPLDVTAWLVELHGPGGPQWWTGRGDEWTTHVDGTPSPRGNGADSAIRFARREDAERAIGWLLEKQLARGCRASEHLWI